MAPFTEDEITCMKIAAKALPQLEGAKKAGVIPTWTTYVLSLLESDTYGERGQKEAKRYIDNATQEMFGLSADEFLEKEVRPKYEKIMAEGL